METIKKHFKSNWLFGALFCASIVMAGSEGSWFPVPNLLGVGLIAILAAKMG